MRNLLSQSEQLRRTYRWIKRNLRKAWDYLYLIPVPNMMARPQADVTVCLTSYPPRIGWSAAAIESMRRQTQPPRRIVLTLWKDDFPDRVLPRNIHLLVARGVEILWTDENYRSFGKLIPIRAISPNETIVTIDDDNLYRRDFLEGLSSASQENPGTIIGYRGWALRVAEGRIAPYRSLAPAGPSTPSDLTFLTGVGGILYPPASLPVEELMDITTAQRVCPTADDIWFWAMARRKATPTLCLGLPRDPFRQIEALHDGPCLNTHNVLGGHNDRQIAQAVGEFDLWRRLETAQLGRSDS